MRTYYPLVILLVLTGFLSCDLIANEIEQNQEAAQKMELFKSAHPEAIFFGKQFYDTEGFFEHNGPADFIYGTPMSTGTNPLESAWNLYNELDGVYAQDVGNLVPGEQLGAMWNKATNSYRFTTFRFQQMANNIPVFRSGIGFLVRNEDNFPVVMTSNNFKELQGFDVAAGAFVIPKANDTMLANAGRLLEEAGPIPGVEKSASVLDNAPKQRLLPVTSTDDKLIVWAGVTNVRVEPELAIVFTAERGKPKDAAYQKHLVIAAVDNGEILYSENQIVGDVGGTVSGRATDSDRALECDPEAPFAMPYAQVEILGGNSVFADVDGNFTIPANGNGDVTVRSSMQGLYFSVFDNAINDQIPFIDSTVAADGSVDFLHNPVSTEFDTSNVNCYLHANIVRDYVLSFEPNFPTIANQTSFTITSNRSSIGNITSCNATYNGVAINFMRNLGACNNTSIPDVIYHEYGHHLVNVTGNNQGQFGEGAGDTIGVLLEDDPELALGFFEGNCGAGIRSANNFRTFPCFDQASPHDCGQLLSGSVWDTLNEIRSVDPTNARDITTGLFLGMLIVRGQMGGGAMIGEEVPNIFLALDDDDSEIGNGTPHYQQIFNGFSPHNFTLPEVEEFFISYPNGAPFAINPEGGTTVEISVEEVSEVPAVGTGMLNVDIGSGFQQIPLTENSPTNFTGTFPAFDCGQEVRFYVSFESVNGGTITLPTDAPEIADSAFSSFETTVVVLDSFDTDTGWTITGNATDGQWQRAIPNNGDRGDPAVDAESAGNGFCFVTDNGNFGTNNTDVDGGSTILTSPVMDATEGEDQTAILSYYRWYNNSVGASPMADIFEVEVSNDGGVTWVELETVGPTGLEVQGGWIQQTFVIGDFVTPTDNTRVRFTASDLDDGSVVEAGVDGFKVDLISCASEPEVLCGDVNLDGFVNLLDVQPFVDLISSGEFLAEADINGDGVVNLLDVGPFVDKLGS